MTKINFLPPELAAKIAAGEVVERPAYAVKELIENSLDAGADSIRIDIEKSGLQKIMVTDNGEGMNREDIQLSYQRFTTSKILKDDDLEGIKSMGFRGEALASIAAISNVTIKSKIKSETAGTEVYITGGKLESISPVGMPTGTSIVVENLFYTVPARQKFLKSQQTEFRMIVQIVSNSALAFPEIRFLLTHNKKTILDLPKNQTPLERAKTLLGNSMVKNLVPLTHDESYVQLSGFIAKPQLSTKSLSKQYLFINGRNVKNKLISSIVKDIYGTLLEPDAYPIFILFLKTPYEMVDVNVHPRKEEVAFHNEETILKAVSQAVSSSLQSNNLTFYDNRWQKSKRDSETVLHIRDGGTSTYAAEVLKEEILEKKTKIIKSAEIIQLHNLYLVTETENGFLLVDQHAAHERILYQKFSEAFVSKKKKPEKFKLENPVLLDLSPEEREILKEYIEMFGEYGFEIVENDDTFTLISVPELLKDRDNKEIITEMLEDLSEGKIIRDIDTKSERMLSYLACRGAIKAGDKVTKDDAKKLLEDLSKCKNPYTCPHGRPTQIEITMKEMNKLFRRN